MLPDEKGYFGEFGGCFAPETLIPVVNELLKAYQAIQNEFLTREEGVFEFVNLEQDLGIEGLRKSKLSYHPFKMIKKFTLTSTPHRKLHTTVV